MVARQRVLVSHVSVEREVSDWLKSALQRDFVGILRIVASSDQEGILLGDDWLYAICDAPEASSVLITRCSPVSVNWAWVSLEVGAPWTRAIPIVPVCHAGLTPNDLAEPLSSRQGITLIDADGFSRLYRRLAVEYECGTPGSDFDALATSVPRPSLPTEPSGEQPLAVQRLARQRDTTELLFRSLAEPKPQWRPSCRLAIEAAIAEDEAKTIRRAHPDEIRFGESRDGEALVRLRRRNGDQ